MSDSIVVEFPAEIERAWTRIARDFRVNFVPSIGSDAVDWILADAKPRFCSISPQSFNYKASLPPACETAMNDMAREFSAFLHHYSEQWLFQLLLLEAELYRATHS
jgi:hypothetical protein